PHPEREIVKVTFKSMNQGVPMLVGMTAGVRGQTPATAPAAGVPVADRAAAKRLLEAAQAAGKAGRVDDALAQFAAASAADPTWDQPSLELARLHESRRDYAAAIAAYQRLLTSTPEHLEALFRLGRAYEDAGQSEQAEQTYRKSLE